MVLTNILRKLVHPKGLALTLSQALSDQNPLISYLQKGLLHRIWFGVLIGLLTGIDGFVIISFQPVDLATQLLIVFAVFFSYWVSTVFCLELAFGNLQKKIEFFRNKQLYKLYLLTFLIFVFAQLMISSIETWLLIQLGSFDFSYYQSNPQLFQPFSLSYIAKLLPLWLVFSFVISIFVLMPPKEIEAQQASQRQRLSVNSDKGLRWLNIDQISHVTSEEHYLRFFLAEDGEQVLAKMSLVSVAEKLPQNRFAQPHRSHLVNLDYFDRMESNQGGWELFLRGVTKPIKISRRRQIEFKKTLSSYSQSI